MKNKKTISIQLCMITLMILIDQLVKYLTVSHLKDKDSIVLINKVFELTYVENRGAAFGMLQNQRIFFLIFTLLVTVAVFILLQKVPYSKRYRLLRITLLVFISGSIGNWIDRFRLSYVIDTFYFSLIDFPVFNVADSYVVVSTLLFAILVLFIYKEEELGFFKFKKVKE